jgi:outer membrane protein OmpA-like peptidoglycan-associated protein
MRAAYHRGFRHCTKAQGVLSIDQRVLQVGSRSPIRDPVRLSARSGLCWKASRGSHAVAACVAAALASWCAAAPAAAQSATATAGAGVDIATPESDDSPAARRARVQNTWLGPTGGLHVVDAGSGDAGVLRLQLGADFFSAGDFMIAGDRNDYAGSVLSLSATVTEYLELFGSISNHANWNDREDPELLQVLGDTRLGAKGSYRVLPWLTVGGDAQLLFFNGIGGIGPSLDSLSLTLRGNASADLRALEDPVPLIGRFSLDYFVDNSAQLIEEVEDARYRSLGDGARRRADEDRHLVRRVERFALGINRVDAVDLALGIEVPLRADDRFFVHPLLEWTLAIPVNRQGYDCLLVPTHGSPSEPDSCLDAEGLSAMSSTVSLGARLFPYLRGLSVLVGVDIGVSGTSTFVRELAPNKPYDVMIAVAYATDVREPQPPPAEVVAPSPPPPPPEPRTARVQGEVVDKSNGAPIERAIVAYPGRDLTAQATDAAGRFVSYELESGEVTFDVSHPDYEPQPCSVQIASPAGPRTGSGAPTSVESREPALNPYFGRSVEDKTGDEPAAPNAVPLRCELTAKPRTGAISGVVQGADGAPVAGARVELSGPTPQSVVSDSLGRVEVAAIAAGSYAVRVDAEGFLLRLQTLDVVASQTATLAVTLEPKPKQASVELTTKEVRIKKQIFFKTNSAQISEKSHGLLSEIADILLRNPQVHLVEIQGHTDSTGNPEVNRELSQLRADAVRQRLIENGVDGARLESKGYGDTRPLLPNLTDRNRAANRRVQFIIKQQD